MATMLAVIAVDLPLQPGPLDALLRRAVDRSFHEITVDGDTSTNDTVLLLSGGDGEPLQQVPEPVALAVQHVAERLARMIVEDGEGMSRVMELRIRGGADEAHAREVARAVAGSSLVKTALAGGDPNWGRILAAAATVDQELDPQRLRLTLGGIAVFADGLPLETDQAALDRAFSAPAVKVELDLGLGDGEARMLTSDLTKRYVEINSEYTT
jgi:glutamate N-acetyltransferase/amino-acid N-acetyltransferase